MDIMDLCIGGQVQDLPLQGVYLFFHFTIKNGKLNSPITILGVYMSLVGLRHLRVLPQVF